MMQGAEAPGEVRGGRAGGSCQPGEGSSSSEAVSEKSGTASIALKSPWIATRSDVEDNELVG